MVRFSVIVLLFVLTCLSSYGQDLGSSNKLFGSPKKKSPPTKSAKKSTSASAKTARTAVKKAAKSKTSKPKAAASKSAKASTTDIGKGESAGQKQNREVSIANPDKRFSGEIPVNQNAPVSHAEPSVGERTTMVGAWPPKGMTLADANEHYEDLISKGNVFRDERNYAAAELAYSNAKSLKPGDSRAVYGLGNLFSDQLRWQDAETHYRMSIEMTPNDAVAHIALSYVLVQPVTASNLADRYVEAEKMARRAIELAPNNALAFDQLGVSLELRGFIGAETESAYRKAIQLDPSFAPPHAHLGRLLRRRGLNKESSNSYQNAIDRAREVGTKILVGEVLQSEQRFAESETLLRAALEEDPRNPTALLLLARALITAASYDEGETVLKKALSIGANGFITNSQLAELYLRQGKTELSENALLQASRFVTDLDRRSLSKSFEAVGDAYMRSGNTRGAERAFKQAITFNGESEILSGKLSRAQQGRFAPGS